MIAHRVLSKKTRDDEVNRLREIDNDLDKTESFFRQNRNHAVRKAINKLRYALIVERHSIIYPGENFWHKS